MMGEDDGSMCGNDEICTCHDVKATMLKEKEKENIYIVIMKMFMSQNPIQIISQTPSTCPS